MKGLWTADREGYTRYDTIQNRVPGSS
jgi:hypothetical protein